MSHADSEAVIDRMAAKRREMGVEDFASYAFIALGILAWTAPEVAGFIFDQTDARLGADQ